MPAIFDRLGDPAPGIVTTHDEFAISFTPTDAQHKVQALITSRDEKHARELFRLCSQEQWNYETAKTELPKLDLDSITTEISYRPFDSRWTIWDSNVAVHRRERVMRHMMFENVAITTSRQAGAIGSAEFDAVMAVERPVDFNFYRRGGEFVFPAYLLAAEGDNAKRSESYSDSFRTFIDERYDFHYSPEEILGYIYAILHAPVYREKYAEFLRQDFPRIPFAEKASDFEALSHLGWELVQAHLLKDYPDDGLGKLDGKGDETVEAVRYSEAEKAVWINKTQCFKPVPEDVWNFHIGGYQVLEKYLKSRKGRQLSLDETKHVGKVADSLAFTITQMAKIDKAYKIAFPDRG
jgi:predicted helicase